MDKSLLTPRAAALERIKAMVLDSLPSLESKRAYRHALDDFFHWSDVEGVGAFTKTAVNAYRTSLEARKLSSSSINLRLCAIRKLALEAADNGLISSDLAASISRVRGAKQIGVRCGKWLPRDQAERLIDVPNASTVKGKRDRAVLAVLLGCGLRRRECVELAVEHIQLRELRWVIVDLIGKGQRVRTVPMPSWTKAAIDDWLRAASIAEGVIFRPVNRSGRTTGTIMTTRAIFDVVRSCGQAIGVSALAPHDLRRTFAKLAHKGRAGLDQIQLSLGHASITTTERYLGVRQDLADAPCDHLGLTIVVRQ